MKYLHILSNVTYGGGEEVLTSLINALPDVHFLFLLRKTSKITLTTSVFNSSPLKSSDSYSLLQQLSTYLYLLFCLFSLRLNARVNSNKVKFVFHGFPCQFALPFARILFPRRSFYFIYHQIKHYRSDILNIPYRIFLFVEYLSLSLASPLSVGAPSERALESIKNIFFNSLNSAYPFSSNFKLFIFKNSFSPFPDIILERTDLALPLISSFDNFVLVVGRFQSVKGHLRLLEFIRNNTNLQNINFVFAGDGPDLPDCQLYCTRYNMKNIYFLGAVPRPLLAHYYRSCMCTFLPSYEESYGVSLHESGYFKKTVLVFSSSLLVAPFVKLVNVNSTSFSVLDITKLSVFPHDTSTFLSTPMDTHESLELNCI